MAKMPTLRPVYIVFGIFLFVFILISFHFKSVKIAGFAEFLPVGHTAFFFEGKIETLPPALIKKTEEFLSIDWENDIKPFAEGNLGVALLTSGDKTDKLKPVAFLEISGPADPLLARLSEKKLYPALLKHTAIIAPNPELLSDFLELQTTTVPRLSSDRAFIKLRKNLSEGMFAFADPEKFPDEAFQWVASLVPNTPLFRPSVGPFGIQVKNNDKTWIGTVYSFIKPDAIDGATNAPPAYRAALLSDLPAGFDFLISGTDLPTQVEKAGRLADMDLTELGQNALSNYLPGVAAEKDIQPLLKGEFALGIGVSKILFIAEVPESPSLYEKTAKFREALHSRAPEFAPKTRDVVLPDGTRAKELVPDPLKPDSKTEIFEGAEIHIQQFEKGRGVFDAIRHNKWFISSDLGILKKALSLEKNSSESFRESESYRSTLRPILKNPELLGIAQFPTATFSFSKRTFTDHMETNFLFRLE